MPLPQGRIFLPARYTSEDLAQQSSYQTQIDDYNALYDQYKADLDAYNEQIRKYNEGPRLEDFTGVEPTAPGQPGVTQDEIDQFNEQAQQRAISNRNMMTTALNVARNPEAYGFGGFGFAEGGNPVVEGVGSLFSPEEQARQEQISAAEIQPDGSMPGVDTLRYATPEEVDVGAYNYQKDLEDNLRYHLKERDKVNPFEFMGIKTERKRFHQNQVEQVQKLIEDFRGQRGAAVANYRDYIAAGGRPLIVNTEEEPYFKSFPTDLINFRATNP